MKYYRELIKKMYESTDACEAAEKEYMVKNEHQLALQEERKKRAEEIDKARKEMIDAGNKYRKLVNDFVHDFKQYHFTTTNIDDFPFNLFDLLL